MPGGPSQAGRFKPRKPAKKIRVGATSASGGDNANAAAPEPVSSAVVAGSAGGHPSVSDTAAPNSATRSRAAEPASTTRRSSAGGGRGGGRHSGRGRGGGRGRGRFQSPTQGQVFFTASAAPNKRKGASSISATVAQRQQGATKTNPSNLITATAATVSKRQHAVEAKQEEEVVGVVEGGGVGGGAEKDRASKRTASRQAPTEPTRRRSSAMDTTSESAFASFDDCIEYNSDSSMEESVRRSADYGKPFSLEPLLLSSSPPPTIVSSNVDGASDDSLAIAPSSPFSCDKVEEENDSWFLVQLPTRLPPLQRSNTTIENEKARSDQPDQSMADVAVRPVQANAFDNVLTCPEATGKLGKIRVYKSGKTVLIFESGDPNRPGVEMDLTEGLSCSFRQQAVAIDDNEFTPLGNVVKTIVATPRLDYS